MSETVDIENFLNSNRDYPIVDVRSPIEFRKGHIPGAFNIPLFSDRERVSVGIYYKKEGRDSAVELGLDIVGPKLKDFVVQCKKISPDGKIKVYCARGGMRSGSFSWLLKTSGFKNVLRLEKGYKAFRNYVLDFFKQDLNIHVVSGMTGSGKTDILNSMEGIGLQVVDLEGFANHRGSAFGAIGKEPETSTERYENAIYNKLRDFDLSKPVFVEDESRNVGKVLVPPEIFKQMQFAPRFVVNLTIEQRAERLARDYTGYGDDQLLESLDIIKKRLSERYPAIVEHIKKREYKEAAILILPYYDKSYKNGLKRRDPETLTYLKTESDSPAITAEEIKELIYG